MEKKSLETKLKNALARTKQFYNGINVEWPSESCGFKEKPIVIDLSGMSEEEQENWKMRNAKRG